jgi:hypothetical protein
MTIKGRLRGIHHKCKGKRIQQYLDEFYFRFNRRGFLDTILNKLLVRTIELNACELNT